MEEYRMGGRGKNGRRGERRGREGTGGERREGKGRVEGKWGGEGRAPLTQIPGPPLWLQGYTGANFAELILCGRFFTSKYLPKAIFSR